MSASVERKLKIDDTQKTKDCDRNPGILLEIPKLGNCPGSGKIAG